MRRSLGCIALLVCFGVLACSAPTELTARTEPEQTATALGAERDASALYVLASGHFNRSIYRGAYAESFWVDLSVRNDAQQKEVGVAWTLDGWATQNTASASFEGALAGGRERWGVDLKDFTTRWGERTFEVQYAAYVRMNGHTSWSLYRNHYIYQDVSPAAPLRLLDSRVELDANGAPFLVGTARALNVGPDRRVFVRFSTDAWRSQNEVEATWDGTDFGFTAELPYDPETTEEVRFAVRLEAEGETIWINDGGSDYVHRLAPMLVEAHFQDDGTRASSGIRVLNAVARSDLSITNAWIRIDGGMRTELPEAPPFGTLSVGGLSSNGSIGYAFPVAALSAGEHVLTLEVAAGPFVRRAPPLTFTVANDIQWLSSWDVTSTETAWDLKARSDGRVLLMRETTLETYATFGASAPESVIALPAGPRLEDADVDESDRVLVLRQGQITRLLPQGDLDTSFGSAGSVTLDAIYGSRPVCYAANIEAFRGFLYVLDSCNSRALQFDDQGAFQAELDLAVSAVSTSVTRTFDDGEHVWIGRDLYDGTLRHELVAIADATTFGIGMVKTLDPAISNLDAFALTPSEIWATSGWDDLHMLDAERGHEQARWTGGRWALPGALHIGRAILPLDDGSIAVLSVDTHKVERFIVRR